MAFENFMTETLRAPTQDATLERLRAGLIGEGTTFPTATGPKPLVYADYTASGRALRQVEDFIAQDVLPFYANTHTESSYTGGYMTRLREEARSFIAAQVGAGDGCRVIFTGSGSTAAINKFASLCGLRDLANAPRGVLSRWRGERHKPLVLIGPYEHHSNILPWRESGADVIEIDEATGGGPDMAQLEAALTKAQNRPLVVGAFSAASNVTGILTDIDAVTRCLKRYGALAAWDFASAGPYEDIEMNTPGAEKDAVFLSPHKFLGGPGASGLLVIRESAVRMDKPTLPGGGSVFYVSPWDTDYSGSLCEREEAGTPNVIGDIRAALAFAVKGAAGSEGIMARDRALVDQALAAWEDVPGLKVLAGDNAQRLPIFSFLIEDASGTRVNHNLVTQMLSDRFGIQARGGCACAGPYGHRLLGLDRSDARRLRAAILAGDEAARPGWTRLNLSYVMAPETVDYILSSVAELAHALYDGRAISGASHRPPGCVDANSYVAH
ncbi:MAG: aminotransferase class V-fold PLP-dependent enzyme [Maritimibacter sp.]